MSRILKFVLPILLIFAVTSCAKVNVEALKKTKRVAVISVFGKESVDVSKATGGDLAGLISEVAQNKETSMKGRITNVKDRIIKKTPSLLGFRVIPESSVIRKRAYKAIDDKNANMFGGFTKAKGYKQIMGNETEKIVQALKSVKKADAAMIVTFNARLTKRGGIVGAENGYMWGDMTFYLYNRKGELILQKTVSNESDSITKIRMGAFSAQNFNKMINETIAKDLKEIKVFMTEAMSKQS
jgi:hypothetical protein